MTALARQEADTPAQPAPPAQPPVLSEFERSCEKLLGVTVARVEYPGGRGRDSRRLVLEDGRRVIATRRANREVAQREARVLRALERGAVLAPKLLVRDGRVLLQEDLGEVRLAAALAGANAAEAERLLDEALASLARCQVAGDAKLPPGAVPVIGRGKGWLREFVRRPAVFARVLDLPPPALDEGALTALLAVRKPSFVKWDARPGNAAVTAGGGSVGWFDWEHAGRRNRLDDLAWLLADEFVPDLPDAEARLLERHLPIYAQGWDACGAQTYTAAFGALHGLIRLGLVLSRKKDKPWRDPAKCLAKDGAGVTEEAALRLCRRGARWAARCPLTEPLAPFYATLEAFVADGAGLTSN